MLINIQTTTAPSARALEERGTLTVQDHEQTYTCGIAKLAQDNEYDYALTRPRNGLFSRDDRRVSTSAGTSAGYRRSRGSKYDLFFLAQVDKVPMGCSSLSFRKSELPVGVASEKYRIPSS